MENRVAGAQASQASPRSSTRPLNPYDARLERAQMKLIRSIANFHPTRVFGSRADKADCDNAAHDIIEFAGMCDEFMREYGEYMAAHSVSITPKNITECFASPFRDALDGNATHILRKAGEELAEAGTRNKRARIFSHATINKLIAAGFAEQHGNLVIIMRGQDV